MIAFDDGPLETTGPILDILERAGAKATFFVVGERIAGRQDLLQRMCAEGHEIGNHSWSHARMPALTDEEIVEELELCDRAIAEACSVRPSRFRPPFVAHDERVLEAAAAKGLAVDVEASFGDYSLTATEIIDECLTRVDEPLWLHDGHWPTVEALPAILAARS